MHWNGTSWTRTPSGTMQQLLGVGGSAANAVWAVGGTNFGTDGTAGVIVRWDGTSWSLVWDSSTAQTGRIGRLWDVWSSGPDDAWAVGDGGLVVHWDGAVWSLVASGTTTTFQGVWGSGADDVWAVGDRSVVLRRRGR